MTTDATALILDEIDDPQVRALVAAATGARGHIEAGDVLVQIILSRNARIDAILDRAMPPGYSLDQLTPIHEHLTSQESRAVGHEPKLAPSAIDALTDFRRMEATAPPGGGVELLLAGVLRALSAQDRRQWEPLRLDELSATLEKNWSRPTHASKVEYFALPAGLVPSDNLTRRVLLAGDTQRFPFDREPVYAGFFESMARGLYRQTPRHLLMVGERGLAQSTLLTELAWRSARGDYTFLRRRQLLTVQCRCVAGDESRATLAALFSRIGHVEPLVACIDGLASLVRTEAGEGNRSHLKSALTQARCRIIGVVRPDELEDLTGHDPELSEMFSIVEIPEPDPACAARLLRHFAAGMERHFGVTIEPAAIDRAAQLTHAYILHERLPNVALKVLEAACEEVRFEQYQSRGTGGTGGAGGAVTENRVLRMVSSITGVPSHTLEGVTDQTDYRRELGELILGQEDAVDEVARELRLIKAGLVDSGKPASVMLFVGQTGTGKTEMAKALARFYSPSGRLKTFTLGNFSEPHSVSGIIGVPAGYVGHDRGGRLINDLNADPYSVFLLDEADKAHPDVMQPFLNLFDEGWIYDQRGLKANAGRAIFILTTNVAQRQIGDMCGEGKSTAEITARVKELLSQIRHMKSSRPVFTAEFLARIRRVVVFRSLDRKAMHGIARRLAQDMRKDWLSRRGKVLQIDERILSRLADLAHERNETAKGKEGGRLIRKLLADQVDAAIQEAIDRDPQRYRGCELVSVDPGESEGGCRVTFIDSQPETDKPRHADGT